MGSRPAGNGYHNSDTRTRSSNGSNGSDNSDHGNRSSHSNAPDSGRRKVWRLLGGVVLAMAILAGGATAWGQLARQSSTAQHTYWQPISLVEVDSDSASVRIEAGAPDRVTVSEVLVWSVRRPSVSQTVTAGTLKISVNCHRPIGVAGCGANLDISVPAATAIRTQDNTGSTLVRGVSGEVRSKATSGQLLLEGVSGPIVARASSGEITARGLASQVVQVSVGSGRVGLEFDRAPRSVTATSSSGPIEVAVPIRSTRYRVDGRTSSGSWDVDPALLDSASDHVIDLTATSGSVTVIAAPS